MASTTLIDGTGGMPAIEGPVGSKVASRPIASVLAVLGSERSGKSTLLNALLDTQFAIRQPTIGSERSAASPDCVSLAVPKLLAGERVIVALDCNGGFAAEDLIRRVGVFALAVADVVVLNMWFHDVGRFRASNHALLCSLFEGIRYLLQPAGATTKKSLFVVVRDAESDTPLGTLQAQILADLEKIWLTAVKPAGPVNPDLQDVFEVIICPCTHFRYAKDEFEKQVTSLRLRILERLSTSSASLPSNELPQFFRHLWDTICRDQQVNLLSERELLAAYLCDQTKARLLDGTRASLQAAIAKESTGFLPDFGTTSLKIVKDVVDHFCQQTEWCKNNWSGWTACRLGVARALLGEVSNAVELQLPRIRATVLAEFKDAMCLLSSMLQVDEWAANAVVSQVARAKALMEGLHLAPQELALDIQDHGLAASIGRVQMESRMLEREMNELIEAKKDELGLIVVRSRDYPPGHEPPQEREPPPPKFSRALFVPILFFCVAGVLFDNGEFRFKF